MIKKIAVMACFWFLINFDALATVKTMADVEAFFAGRLGNPSVRKLSPEGHCVRGAKVAELDRVLSLLLESAGLEVVRDPFLQLACQYLHCAIE